MVDYSAERVSGHVVEKEEDKPEAEKDEEQPIQIRSSGRARKPPMTFLDEAKAKMEECEKEKIPAKLDDKKEKQRLATKRWRARKAQTPEDEEGAEPPAKKVKVSLSIYVLFIINIFSYSKLFVIVLLNLI